MPPKFITPEYLPDEKKPLRTKTEELKDAHHSEGMVRGLRKACLQCHQLLERPYATDVIAGDFEGTMQKDQTGAWLAQCTHDPPALVLYLPDGGVNRPVMTSPNPL